MDTVRFVLVSEIFSALSHPKRLEIISHIGLSERGSGELAALTNLPKANVSQHLNVLKSRSLVYCEKFGTSCRYRLTSPKVLEVCDLIRQMILDQMELTTEKRKSLAEVTPFKKERKEGA
ncbi:MAG: putative transcriptional regulator, ArsR family [Leptospirillum sp. Group II 'C75']|jgi:ArsR family transcriptional regulator|uniref:Probable transcriptional regulator, ArsR family n=1 Tax=Leptospirillum sp. Group II '5-way CG' TaxID=419541 RepID=B6ARY2_9BACT|nr:metalloregulator ArsR/SmtB family transcription factor [Leptospirillum sp. Group II 'CF-1']AKS23141.1 ArsR family transcriptional regulator [Leptospirillum sp. Group II 'CF-1']EAY57028.1 MAG: probable transcriptional regulator, ArsR family [Leptospirillum rubarum]EDZ38228.1 MAG: Probable transcriptional regulator, ArsR family [Leptospirillum sp. Group II '5-way CG']EIJ75220.1 MAG: putative transcriptional regulator, ArsR family [Leptospirillum sp. Group II 'C75']